MFKCSICLSSEDDIGATPCGHVFCIPCLTRHLESHSHCPKCRGPCIMELVIRLHADFDDDTTSPMQATADLLSATHPLPTIDDEERAEDYGSAALHIDPLEDLTANLNLNLMIEFSPARGKGEDEDERNSTPPPALSTSELLTQDSRNVTIAGIRDAFAVKGSLTNLVATITSLLTRLKYSIDLTNYFEEAAYLLAKLQDKTVERVRLAQETRQAERERDASECRYTETNERMISRLKQYKDEKAVYLKKQLEVAQEREINAIQIIRLESAMEAMKNRADKYEARFIALGGECDSSDDDGLEWESYSVWDIENITNSMPGAFPDVDTPPPRKRAREERS